MGWPSSCFPEPALPSILSPLRSGVLDTSREPLWYLVMWFLGIQPAEGFWEKYGSDVMFHSMTKLMWLIHPKAFNAVATLSTLKWFCLKEKESFTWKILFVAAHCVQWPSHIFAVVTLLDSDGLKPLWCVGKTKTEKDRMLFITWCVGIGILITPCYLLCWLNNFHSSAVMPSQSSNVLMKRQKNCFSGIMLASWSCIEC